ncbi:MAG: tail fiber domain-containing protein [Bacteroidota bacterium]
MKRIFFLLNMLLAACICNSQSIGMGTLAPNSSAQLDISNGNKGLLIPRVSLTSLSDAVTIASPATSLLIFNTNASLVSGTGYYYNSGTAGAPVWVKMLTSSTAGWSLTGNSGTDPATNFIGTTDSKRLQFRVANQPSGWIDHTTGTTFFGYNAGRSFPFGTNSGSTGFGADVMVNFVGARNVAVGSSALSNNGQFGYLNTAIGFESMFSNANGAANVAVGNTSLHNNGAGNRNVAIGDSAMFFNTSGSNNTALGAYALKNNLTTSNNIAVGYQAMENATGSLNTAIGISSLQSNTTGSANTAVGYVALTSNLTGTRNVAVGYNALRDNNSGIYNTAVGYGAMSENTSGQYNASFGYIALNNNLGGDENAAFGAYALAGSRASSNTAVGYEALRANTTSSANIAIGKSALALQSYSNDNTPYGGNNIAVGVEALYSNQPTLSSNFQATNGIRNIAIGNYTLRSNTIGSRNTAIGHSALSDNIGGFWNNAFGHESLLFNTSGSENVSIGNSNMRGNTTGSNNVSVGVIALYSNTSGDHNTAVGNGALNLNTSGYNNTAVGSRAGGFNNANIQCTFLGYDADQESGSNYVNSMALGYNSRITATNQVRIGHSAIASIGGYQPWSNLSDGRFKKNISEQVKGLDFIMALRPVTYNIDMNSLAGYLKEDVYKNEKGIVMNKVVDAHTVKERSEQSLIVHSGFIAQEVEAAANKINYKFSGVDKPKNSDDLYALRYAEFVVPLVKGMQEQQQEIADLKQRIQKLEELLNKFLPAQKTQ